MAAGELAKVLLSGSTNGRGIKVAASSSPGTTIHTADATAYDDISLWAQNHDTVERTLTVEFGGTTSPEDRIVTVLPPDSGLTPIVPGLPLTGGVVVKAFGDAANVISVRGYVLRIG